MDSYDISKLLTEIKKSGQLTEQNQVELIVDFVQPYLHMDDNTSIIDLTMRLIEKERIYTENETNYHIFNTLQRYIGLMELNQTSLAVTILISSVSGTGNSWKGVYGFKDRFADFLTERFYPPQLSKLEFSQTIKDIIKGIKETERYSELGVLADAMEEEGITEELILDHCRDNRNHTKQCWVLNYEN